MMNFPVETVSMLGWDNSLFSTIITLYTLLLLYSPSILLPFLFSPVFITTLILLLYLLRLGADESSHFQNKMGFSLEKEEEEEDIVAVGPGPAKYSSTEDGSELQFGSDPNPYNAESFVEWDVRAPLEVIYEENGEGDEIESEVDLILRYASLSLFYPESDSDEEDGNFPADGEWISPEDLCFRWEEEEDKEAGLIEIALDGKRISDYCDEENLIEIDISLWTEVDYRRAAE